MPAYPPHASMIAAICGRRTARLSGSGMRRLALTHSFPQIIQEFRRWFHACHEQVIPCPSAGDVKQVPFGGIDLFEIRVVAYCLDSCLEWNHLVVTSHHNYGPEL